MTITQNAPTQNAPGQNATQPRVASPHLRALESEAIHILREVAGQLSLIHI